MGHPNGKVARASHSMFVSFVSSEKDTNDDERVSLKEQLVFYYIQRSLEVSRRISCLHSIFKLNHIGFLFLMRYLMI